MSAADQPLAGEIAKLASLIATARRLLAGGTGVELSALEEKVAALCAALTALPPDEARPLVPALERLLGSLDRLREDLDSHYGRLGCKIAAAG